MFVPRSNHLSILYSAVIIARNESRTISDCIHALRQVSDDIIVVLDDRSTDETSSLANSMGARVLPKSWEGYSINKNYGADHARYDWVLCLDADEIIDDQLIQSLKNLDLSHKENAYLFNILTYVGDMPVWHCGWYPDWNIRLYHRHALRWNDRYVHEKLIPIKGEIHAQRIDGIVHHRSFADWRHMEDKYDYYARMRAQEWIKDQRKPSIFKRYLGPSFRFFRTYFLKLGILDGLLGYEIAKREYTLKRKEWIYYDEMQQS
jgi:glycosyltransferase involved in cell wall biosynthesis